MNIILHKTDNGIFQQLLVRTTSWTPKFGFNAGKFAKEARLTEQLSIYSLDAELNMKLLQTIRPATNKQYFWSATDRTGHLNVIWATESQLMLEQYQGEAVPAVSVSKPFVWDERQIPIIIAKQDSNRQGFFALAISLANGDDREIKTFLFNAIEKKAYLFEEVLNNDYRKVPAEQSIVADG